MSKDKMVAYTRIWNGRMELRRWKRCHNPNELVNLRNSNDMHILISTKKILM